MNGTVSYQKQVKMSETKKPKRHIERGSSGVQGPPASLREALRAGVAGVQKPAAEKGLIANAPASKAQSKDVSTSMRDRVLRAAFALFSQNGFSSTSMLDIVTRARISKRDLYALFNNKHAVLAACINERCQQMRRPLDTPAAAAQTQDELAALLVEVGASILKIACQPEVLTVFRLAISESDLAPEIGRTLDSAGRDGNQKALTELIRKAQARGLILAADPTALAARYLSVLWGDLLIRLLLRVREAPAQREIEARARAATDTLIALP
jgi:AcrR family transcriptional regulator